MIQAAAAALPASNQEKIRTAVSAWRRARVEVSDHDVIDYAASLATIFTDPTTYIAELAARPVRHG